MTSDDANKQDLAGLRRAVQLRDRCRKAAMADGRRLDIPLTGVQANVAFDAMVDPIRADERDGGTSVAAVKAERDAALARAEDHRRAAHEAASQLDALRRQVAALRERQQEIKDAVGWYDPIKQDPTKFRDELWELVTNA